MITENDKTKILRHNAKMLLRSTSNYERDYIIRILEQFAILMGSDKDGIEGFVLEIVKNTERKIEDENERAAQWKKEDDESIPLDFDGLDDDSMKL